MQSHIVTWLALIAIALASALRPWREADDRTASRDDEDDIAVW